MKEYRVETKNGVEWLTVARIKKMSFEELNKRICADNGYYQILGIEHGINDHVIVGKFYGKNKEIHVLKINYEENDTTFKMNGIKYSFNDFFRV